MILLTLFLAVASTYKIGTGIADITGPAVEVNFMGYANPSQTGRGIHLRLRARAFVVDDGTKHVAFVSIDGGMGSDLVNQKVIEVLDQTVGKGIYTYENLCISGTHSHSGPAGILQYVLFQFTSFGFVHETFGAVVAGISKAITNAHKNLENGKIFVNQGILNEANINRSPTSYLLNPEEERKRYETNTDNNMLLLRFVNDKGEDVGALNWFAVHGTSMNNTNRLISGDNKGYASYLLEQHVNGPTSQALPGTGKFVAAFASTNLGDVSPNTKGPHCMDTGLPCDLVHSTCKGKNEMCVSSGPGKDMFESTQIIATKQYEHALNLMKTATIEVTGPIDFKHKFVSMPSYKVKLATGETKSLCNPAMGYAFAAGTTDGPGMFDFTQGTNSSNPFWNLVSGLLSKPTKEEIACQAPKPILLNTGDIHTPYDWDPTTVPTQILRIGQVFIASIPAEFTTMAGRRMREMLATKFKPLTSDPILTIAGLSNTYADYVTTFEEYQGQRYEAASTIFGPHTHDGYMQIFSGLADNMIAGTAPSSDPNPPDLLSKQLELLPGVIFDRCPFGKDYGDILADAKKYYMEGQTVSVRFQGANPRNNQHLDGTFLTVENLLNNGKWQVVAVDGDWDTKFEWENTSTLTGTSEVTISWSIPPETTAGNYRVCYFGEHKNVFQSISSFSKCSSSFTLSAMGKMPRIKK